MGNPVLLAVFAGNCGACQRFKSTELEKFRAAANSSGVLTLVEVHLPAMGVKVSEHAKLSSDIDRHVGWFPIFMLISSESWKRRGPYEVEVCPQQSQSGGVNGIIGWAKGRIASNPIYSEGSKSSVVYQSQDQYPTYGSMKNVNMVRRKPQGFR